MSDTPPPTPIRGYLFILSAPSGAGKSTLSRILLERLPDLRYSISTTTRPARSGEVAGIDYHFTDVAQFKALIEADQWAEWAKVHGNFYGTSAVFIEEQQSAGHDILLDIDVQGAAQLRSKYPDAITIFIMPPSLHVLRERLEQRGTDMPETIAKRLANAREEMAQRGAYRHVIVNDNLEEAANELVALFQNYREGRTAAE